MRAGSLRHKITIQKCTIAKNSYGEAVKTWTSGLNTWGAIWPLRGNESFSASQMQAGVTHKVRMRYNTLENSTVINPECRIKYGSRYLSIESVLNPDERSIMLDMMCKEEV